MLRFYFTLLALCYNGDTSMERSYRVWQSFQNCGPQYNAMLLPLASRTMRTDNQPFSLLLSIEYLDRFVKYGRQRSGCTSFIQLRSAVWKTYLFLDVLRDILEKLVSCRSWLFLLYESQRAEETLKPFLYWIFPSLRRLRSVFSKV